MNNKYFYERSGLLNSEFNITFNKLLLLNKKETLNWLEQLRLYILSEWDKNNIPPVIGQSEKKIISNFRKLREYPMHMGQHRFLYKNDIDNQYNIIKNFNKFGTGINQFFPTMLKTKIGSITSSASIYDYFTDAYKEKFYKTLLRTLKRDGIFNWSKCIPNKNIKAIDWIKENQNTSFFIAQHTPTNQIKNSLQLTADEIKFLYSKKLINYSHITNLLFLDEINDKYVYLIKVYNKTEKIFPKAIQIFRLSFVQPAVNFPPLTARFLYEKYTMHIKNKTKLIIYDPSAGWGGRILGAMASVNNIHYIGTDPNTDNFIPELNLTRYEYVANFFNTKVLKSTPFWSEHKNTYHIFKDGSEHIHNNPDFKQYKNKIDLIFTSPPYFNKEQYSADISQSWKAYQTYDSWKQNFLAPTLETCVNYLKENRYLLWNISDIKYKSNSYYPLEKDSIEILCKLGMEYKGKLLMLMSTVIGPSIITFKNVTKFNNKMVKYEPIFIFYKPTQG